jgi:hypothetical protein
MNSLLTTLLLVDAVEKGGPGSGPHPGAAKETKEQRFRRILAEDFGKLKPSAGTKPSKPSVAKPAASKEQSPADMALLNMAEKSGAKLYGKDLIIDEKTVERGSVKQYMGGGDGKSFDTFDYVFKPSTGKAYDVADSPINASHADVDGKIYVAGANGVFVITSGFGKK